MKLFWGYNNEEEARADWGDWLDIGKKTIKKYYTRIELPFAIIGY